MSVNPATEVIVMVEFPVTPIRTVTGPVSEIAKSGVGTVMTKMAV